MKTISNLMFDVVYLQKILQWTWIKANYLDLSGIVLNGVDFSYSCLEHTSFSNAFLQGAKFVYAHLEGTDLARAHLEGANFHRAYFDKKTNFYGASIDEHTQFDPGVREKYFPDFGKEKQQGAED